MLLRLLAIKLLLFASIVIGILVSNPISLKYLVNQITYVVTLANPMYSTFTINNATVSYHFVSYDTGLSAIIKRFPSVDCLVSLYPA